MVFLFLVLKNYYINKFIRIWVCILIRINNNMFLNVNFFLGEIIYGGRVIDIWD